MISTVLAFISLGRIIVVNRLGVDDGKDNVKGEERPPRFSCGGGRCRVCNIGHAPRQLQIRTSVTPDMQVGKFGTRQLSWDRARSRAIGTPSSENRMDGGDSYGCSRPVPFPHLPRTFIVVFTCVRISIRGPVRWSVYWSVGPSVQR